MRSRLRLEKPFSSGSSLRRSLAKRGMTPAPHPSAAWRSSSNRPMPQYSRISSALTASTERVCAAWMRALMSASSLA